MELEFGKHFKDATNLLIMMDHDSGYVEGTDSYISSNECHSLKSVGIEAHKESENFLLSEDALLEKPELAFNFAENLTYEIDIKEYEESRKLFFSPEVISESLESQNSTIVYSGLENESLSNFSAELPLQQPIVMKTSDVTDANVEYDQDLSDSDVLMITASESDMSLETTFEPIILEKINTCVNSNCNLINPLRWLPDNQTNLDKSAVILENENYLESEPNTLSSFQGQPDTGERNVKDLHLENYESRNTTNISKTSVTEVNEKNLQVDKLQDKLLYCNLVNSPHKTESQCPTQDLKVNSEPKSETPIKTNPLSVVTNTFESSTEKRRLTLVFSRSEKENGYSVKRKYPSMTPDKNIKPVNPNISPDIFDDELNENKPIYFEVQDQDTALSQLSQTHTESEEKHVDKLDQKLLKKVLKGLSGVLPPPSVTVVQMSVHDILSKLKENKKNFFWNCDVTENKQDSTKQDTSLNSSTESNSFSKSVLLSVDLKTVKSAKWPADYNMRCHGLSYNCGKISEEIVDLCDKYQKRFVGAETQSTCTVFQIQNITSPTKRKVVKPRWGGGKSPGRRLSHLARRRITFSSANLQGSGSSLAGSRARQILVDAKKIDMLNRRRSPRKSPRKTPRKTPKKTPNKSPKIKTRTPSSSAKKKLAMRFRKLTGEFEKSIPSTSEVPSVHRALFKSPDKMCRSENNKGTNNKNTKRALFQSPSRDNNSSLFTSKSQDLTASAERKDLRRALFTSPRKGSPLKNKSPFKHVLKFEKKRKRSESDDILHTTKFPRSMSMDVRPTTSSVNKSLSRTQSELNISLNKSQSQNELSEQHKKKLLWAVSGALQSQNITNTHTQWKVYASVLARVTRRFFTNQLSTSKSDVGTSERMHRIARYHVISVIKGKTADEIIYEYIKNKAKVQRPQGYVAPEGLSTSIKAPSGGKENVFQDRANTIESWEKRKLKPSSKPATTENKIERIRKVINFGDDR